MKLMENVSSSTNAIAHFAEGRAVRYPMPLQLFRTETFGGFVVLSSSHRGRKNQGSAPIFVPPAALPYRIYLGICLTSGFPLGCLRAMVGWKSLPIYVSRPKLHGTPPLFKELALTSCRRIFLSSSRFYRQPMPNTTFEGTLRQKAAQRPSTSRWTTQT